MEGCWYAVAMMHSAPRTRVVKYMIPPLDTWTTTTGSYPEVGGPTGVILLNSGKVLAVLNNSLGAVLFDPAAGTWSATGAPLSLQSSANLTLLNDGRVLMSGGYVYSAGTATALATAQIYDPATGTWTTTGSMGLGGPSLCCSSGRRQSAGRGRRYRQRPPPRGDRRLLLLRSLTRPPACGARPARWHNRGGIPSTQCVFCPRHRKLTPRLR